MANATSSGTVQGMRGNRDSSSDAAAAAQSIIAAAPSDQTNRPRQPGRRHGDTRDFELNFVRVEAWIVGVVTGITLTLVAQLLGQ